MAKRKRHNYEKKLESALEGGYTPPPGLSILHIAHDDTCSIWKAGGICDCNPDMWTEVPAANAWPEKMKRLLSDNAQVGNSDAKPQTS